MADNKYTGEVEIEIGGKKLSIVYPWTAQAEIETLPFASVIQDLSKAKITELTAILMIGLKEKHPDIKEEFIVKSSPPRMMMAKAMDTALLYAAYGPEQAEEILASIEEINGNIKKVVTGKKKTK